MNELKAKILEKIKEHTLASFATITGDGKPWTRYVVVKADDQLNIWFATFKNSRKVRQIAENAEVHLSLGVAEPETATSWLQVQGKAEITWSFRSYPSRALQQNPRGRTFCV